MASLATMYNRFLGVKTYREANSQAAGNPDDPYILRAIASEDVFFFTKSINNARVVREADPRARRDCWKLIASGGMAVMLLVGVLFPTAYGLIAGYQIQSLKQEQERLVTEKSGLEMDEARLLSSEWLGQKAREQAFIDPGPQKVVYLNGKGSLAMNAKPAGQ